MKLAQMPDTAANRIELSEMPDPQWYLEQFRAHIGTIHELFKDCPSQRWKVLSLAIGDALAGVRKTISSAGLESPK